MSFHAIREYAPGDSRRQIHWKSTAKTGQLMVRQYEESRRSRMAVVLVGRGGRVRAMPTSSSSPSAAPRRSGCAPCTTRASVDIVTGIRDPARRARPAACHPAHPGSVAGARCSTGSARVEMLENTMPIAEVCRLAGGGGRAAVDRVRRRRLEGDRSAACSQAALGFPADTAVVAVICDERAHPRMRAAVGAHRAHRRHARRPVGPAPARGDVMSAARAAGARRAVGVVPLAPGVAALRIVAGRCSSPPSSRSRRSRRGRSTATGTCSCSWSASSRWPPPRSPRSRGAGAGAAGRSAAVLVARGAACSGSRSPCRRASAARLELLRGLGEVASGAVLAWKDLVTVDLPVGTYRNLLVPALHRVPRRHLRGPSAVVARRTRGVRRRAGRPRDGLVRPVLRPHHRQRSARRRAGRLIARRWRPPSASPRLLSCLLWLAWRSRDERVRSLRRAAASSGVRVSRRRPAVDRRRAALGAGMVAVAVLAAAVVVPLAARGADREVLRSSVGPEVAVASAVSPLAEYRALFADDRADDVLFTVTADGELPDRVRLATLDSYDGEIYRSGGDRRPRSGALRARALDARRRRGAPRGCGGHHPGSRRDLDADRRPAANPSSSTGARAASLADRFYYRAAAGAGVQTAGGGLTDGDAYRLTAVEPNVPDLAAIEAPGGLGDGSRFRRACAPGSTSTSRARAAPRWPASSGCCASAATSATPWTSATTTLPLWMQSLPDYTFQPSASGHSLARIDALFARLLEREVDPRAAASANYVAAVGDDEQFAAAVALDRPRARIPVARRRRRAAGLRRPGAAHVRCGRLPGAGSGGVDRGAVRGGRLGAGRCHAAVQPVAEPRGDRAAQPRERDRGASRVRRGRGSARPGPGGLRRRRPQRRRRGARPVVALAGPAHHRHRAAGAAADRGTPRWRSPRPRPPAADRVGRRASRRRASPAAGTSTSMPRSMPGATRRRCSPAASSPACTRRPAASSSRRMPTAPSSPARH